MEIDVHCPTVMACGELASQLSPFGYTTMLGEEHPAERE
jgi:hypothetical protein